MRGSADKAYDNLDIHGAQNMSDYDEDDRPTVVLDLNALKKQKLKDEEDLANMASKIEFNVHHGEKGAAAVQVKEELFKVIYFDFQSNLFSEIELPHQFSTVIVNDIKELNQHLKSKDFQIAVFNYDAHPKAVNQLTLQIKQKLPSTKTIIVAKNISPEKAKLHAKTPSGADGYLSQPLSAESLRSEFLRIFSKK